MKNRTLVIVLVLGSLLLGSCLFGIRGNGKVVKSEREVGAFESISVSGGLEVSLLQDSVVKVMVEADENLQAIIKTEVSHGELKIYPEKQIRHAEAKKIFVSFKSIKAADVNSGALLKSEKELKLASFSLSASSGADIDLAVAATQLGVQGSSGSNISLKGTAESLDVDGSSGANIMAAGLQSKTANAGASSGSSLKIAVSEKLGAKASSGGNIKVSGHPKDKSVETSSGGDVRFN